MTITACPRNFNPRSPWGERPYLTARSLPCLDFNPRSPWGERPCCAFTRSCVPDFNPRSPWGERPGSAWGSTVVLVFQSTLPVGGATRLQRQHQLQHTISIHAPRGGSDQQQAVKAAADDNFNPRSPWGERRAFPPFFHVMVGFQSTLPVGGATEQGRNVLANIEFQSTLPVGGATGGTTVTSAANNVFQSTLPVGGATSPT